MPSPEVEAVQRVELHHLLSDRSSLPTVSRIGVSPTLPRHNLRLWLRPALQARNKHIYARTDAPQNLSLGEVRLDTALVGPRKAFAKCNRRKLNSLCSNTRSLSRCELQAAPPTCVVMPAG